MVVVDVELDRSLDASDDAAEDAARAYADQADWDPRRLPEPYVFLFLRPRRVQAWRESNELSGRLLMRDSEWLF